MLERILAYLSERGKNMSKKELLGQLIENAFVNEGITNK